MAVVKEDEIKEKADDTADTDTKKIENQNQNTNDNDGDEQSSDSRKTAWTEDGTNDKKKVMNSKSQKADNSESGDINLPELEDIHEEMDIDEDVDENEDNEDGGDEEEEEETEMSDADKAALVEAARSGNYLQLQDLWDKPNADINMTWFNENLLTVAIRAGNEEMAEFLIDNGVDHNFESVVFDLKENPREKDKIIPGKRVDCYTRSCRQIAFEKGMSKIVEMIDLKNNNWFPFVKPVRREPRYRRPPPPPIPEKWRPVIEEDEEGEGDSEGNKLDTNRTSITNKSEVVIKTDEDGDSGHQSMKDGDISMFSDMFKRGNSELYDEGYGTVSNSPYLSPPKESRPFFITRPTKSSMLLYGHNSEIRRRRLHATSAPEKRHLNVTGSYSRESRLWHLPRRKQSFTSVSTASTGTRVQSSVITHGSAPAVLKSDIYRQKSNLTSQNKGQSPLSQISKILGESRLLSSQSELGLPYIRSTHIVGQNNTNSRKLLPWCHGNSSEVFKQLKDAKIQNRISDPKFMVNSALFSKNHKHTNRK